MMLHPFSRTELLIGTEGLKKLKNSTVAIFGIGGVGSFTAEALARSGVYRIVLIDGDDICLTNINRQIHALHSTVGKSKVETMKARILDINPKAEVIIYKEYYNSESAEKLLSDGYDYVIDAIDMVDSKLDLIERCKKRNIPIISAMGAGNKLDPTRLEVDDIYKTSNCPLAKIMRKQLKKRGIKNLKVVYSKECNKETGKVLQSDKGMGVTSHYKDDRKAGTTSSPDRAGTCDTGYRVLGSVPFVPSVAGLIMASEVVYDLIRHPGTPASGL
ncbi:MAG: tRNA threonylcarbamoyladenosine dehydratase [Candidatus Alkaliphilus sp. MAG34]